MRAAVLLLCSLMLSGCASLAGTFDGWRPRDRALYDAGVACIVADYLQTESALDSGQFAEGNPLVGRSPSDERLAAITGVRAGAYFVLADSLAPAHRTLAFSLALLPCVATVSHNHAIGVRVRL